MSESMSGLAPLITMPVVTEFNNLRVMVGEGKRVPVNAISHIGTEPVTGAVCFTYGVRYDTVGRSGQMKSYYTPYVPDVVVDLGRESAITSEFGSPAALDCGLTPEPGSNCLVGVDDVEADLASGGDRDGADVFAPAPHRSWSTDDATSPMGRSGRRDGTSRAMLRRAFDSSTSCGQSFDKMVSSLREKGHSLAATAAQVIKLANQTWSNDNTVRCTFDAFLRSYLVSDSSAEELRKKFITSDVMLSYCEVVLSITRAAGILGTEFGRLLHHAEKMECSTNARLELRDKLRSSERALVSGLTDVYVKLMAMTLQTFVSLANTRKSLESLQEVRRVDRIVVVDNQHLTHNTFRLVITARRKVEERWLRGMNRLDKDRLWTSAVWRLAPYDNFKSLIDKLVVILMCMVTESSATSKADVLSSIKDIVAQVQQSEGKDGVREFIFNTVTGLVYTDGYVTRISPDFGSVVKGDKNGLEAFANKLYLSCLLGMSDSTFSIPKRVVDWCRLNDVKLCGFPPLSVATTDLDVLVPLFYTTASDGQKVLMCNGMQSPSSASYDVLGYISGMKRSEQIDGNSVFNKIGIDGSNDWDSCVSVHVVGEPIESEVLELRPADVRQSAPITVVNAARPIKNVHSGTWLYDNPWVSLHQSAALHTLMHWEFDASKLLVVHMGHIVPSLTYADQFVVMIDGFATSAKLLKSVKRCAVLKMDSSPPTPIVGDVLVRIADRNIMGGRATYREDVVVGAPITICSEGVKNSDAPHTTIRGSDNIGLTIQRMVRSHHIYSTMIRIGTGNVEVWATGAGLDKDKLRLCSNSCRNSI